MTRWARQIRGQGGFTMPEMIVTVMLLGVVSVFMLNFLDNTTTATSKATNDVTMEQDGQLALRSLTEDLRSARAISQCAGGVSYASCVTVEIAKSTNASQTCPKRVATYQAIGTTLVQKWTDYAADCTTATRSVNHAILSGVQSISIFTYYATDAITPLDPVVDAARVPLTPVIKITIPVKYKGRGASVVTLSSFASLRNNR